MQNPCCNGSRHFSANIFKYGLPPVSLLSVENLQHQHLSHIPSELALPSLFTNVTEMLDSTSKELLTLVNVSA